MALTTASFDSSVFTYKIVDQSDTVATANIDVTGGKSGNIYAIDIDNGRNVSCAIKFTLTSATPVVGTTSPDIVVWHTAGQRTQYLMPAGLAFTVLSFWATTEEADSGTTAPSGAYSNHATGKLIVTVTTS
tara:strand:+ start:72 stop:464 length:393 start_codon:yes stop_codon:yes gene_type:complete